MATLAAIRQALAEYSSPRVQVRETIVHRASVAVILAGLPHELRACFIRRAERPADRWSGQMAFPGGHREAQDADLTATAQRETLEEIGLSLETAERLGELSESPIAPRRRGEAGILSAFVFYIGRDQPPLTPNAEVAATYWTPIDHLWAPENRTTVEWDAPVGRFRLPGVQYETRVIWGLTYRVLESFFEAIGKSLPARGPIVG